MPFNGLGTYSVVYNWQNDAANGINITASRFDGQDGDMANAFNNTLTRDGQGSPTANMSWNGYSITNVVVTMLTASTVEDSVGTPYPVGYLTIPQNAQAGAYVISLSDAGKHVFITTGGITIPLNATTAFPIGSGITIINNNTVAQNVTPTGGVTLKLAGTTLTGVRSMGPNALATIIKVDVNTWWLSGTGVS